MAVSGSPPSVVLAALKRTPGVLDATLVEAEIHLLVRDDLDDSAILAVPGTHDVRPIEPSLEDVFSLIHQNLLYKPFY